MNRVTHSARAQTGLYRSFTHPPPSGYDATQAQYLNPPSFGISLVPIYTSE